MTIGGLVDPADTLQNVPPISIRVLIWRRMSTRHSLKFSGAISRRLSFLVPQRRFGILDNRRRNRVMPDAAQRTDDPAPLTAIPEQSCRRSQIFTHRQVAACQLGPGR